MAFSIKPNRRHEFEHEEDGEKLVAVFDFVCTEDGVPKNIRERISEENALDVVWYNIRRSLKEIRGATDADTGEAFTLTDSEGNVDEGKQKAAFEFLISLGMGPAFLASYLGTDPKNSKAGATQQSIGSGDRSSVEDASPEKTEDVQN